jgi:hypothetical protein
MILRLCDKGIHVAHECRMLRLRGFLKKHASADQLAGQWFRQEYCTGPKEDECKRKAYMIEHGKVPPGDMSPSGEMMQPVESR